MEHTTTTLTQDNTAAAFRLSTFLHAVLFVFGFSFAFVLGWGGTFTVFGRLFAEYRQVLSQIGAIIVIGFGLFNLGIIKLRWLNFDTRPVWRNARSASAASSILMGVFFAAGWTPCIGTTLGAILTLGFSQSTAGQAMFLSFGYVLGLGMPFIFLGLGVARISRALGTFKRHIRKIQIVSGLFLISIGILILTNQMYWISTWAQRNGLWLDVTLGDPTAPTFLVALLAGLLSFLSPCVLPLVPAYLGYLGGQGIRNVS